MGFSFIIFFLLYKREIPSHHICCMRTLHAYSRFDVSPVAADKRELVVVWLQHPVSDTGNAVSKMLKKKMEFFVNSLYFHNNYYFAV